MNAITLGIFCVIIALAAPRIQASPALFSELQNRCFNGTCQQQAAFNGTTGACLPNSQLIEYAYFVQYSTNTLSFTTTAASVTIDGTTYTVNAENQVAIPWSEGTSVGFFDATYGTGSEACFYVDTSGSFMMEWGLYTVSAQTPRATCPNQSYPPPKTCSEDTDSYQYVCDMRLITCPSNNPPVTTTNAAPTKAPGANSSAVSATVLSTLTTIAALSVLLL